MGYAIRESRRGSGSSATMAPSCEKSALVDGRSSKRACLGDPEAFKKSEYMPLIEHHKDCEGEEETDEGKKTVTKCCKACKCIFFKAGGEDEDEDE